MKLKMAFQGMIIDRREIAGSLGDVGIFIPLALSLIGFNGLNPFNIFFSAGLLYIGSGIYFGHPVSVQPLKALAVTALAIGASGSMISAAGIIMGGILLLIHFTEVSAILGKLFTKPMIRGVQLGLGFMLIEKGIDYLLQEEFLFSGHRLIFSVSGYIIPAGCLAGAVSFLVILKFYNSRRVPASLLILGIGLIAGVTASVYGEWQFSGKIVPSALPGFLFPAASDFIPALFLLVIPQIPLTVGNALFAASDTAGQYFPGKAGRTTPKALALSLGIANTLIGTTGGIPLCHGAGGITAHYRFGARSIGSNLIIGSVFILIAVASLIMPVSFLYLIPVSTLGGMLIFTGLEHAMLMKDIVSDRTDFLIAMVIGSTAVSTGNLFIGFSIGLLVSTWMMLSNPFSKSVKGEI